MSIGEATTLWTIESMERDIKKVVTLTQDLAKKFRPPPTHYKTITLLLTRLITVKEDIERELGVRQQLFSLLQQQLAELNTLTVMLNNITQYDQTRYLDACENILALVTSILDATRARAGIFNAA